MTLEHSVKCFRRRRQRWASHRATIFRKRRTLPSGRECLSTPCARYIFRCSDSAPCRFIYPSLPPLLPLPFFISFTCSLSLSLSLLPSSSLSFLPPSFFLFLSLLILYTFLSSTIPFYYPFHFIPVSSPHVLFAPMLDHFSSQ